MISFVPATRCSGSDPSPVDEPELAVLRALARRLCPFCLRPLALLVAALLLATEADATGLVNRIAGAWQAVAKDSFVRALEVDGDDSGFRLRVVLTDGREWVSRLKPGPKPGLFSAAQPTGGFLEWFASRQRGGPLEGEPVTWARTTADGLVVYRLEILPSGRFELLRISLEPTEARLQVRTLEHGHATSWPRHADWLTRIGGRR